MDDAAIDVHEVRLWFAQLGRGVAGAVFGLVLMSGPWPRVEQTAVGLFVYLLVDSALSFYAANRVRLVRGRPALIALVGVVDAGAALMAFLFPAALPLRLIAGFRGIATGLCDARWSRRHNLTDLLTLNGVAAVALGIVLVGWPGPGEDALSWLVGIQVMVSGSLLFAGALSELRRVETTVATQAA